MFVSCVVVENARFRDWVAHYNAVFDISWIKVSYLLGIELCINDSCFWN